jgi:hypothetical protein
VIVRSFLSCRHWCRWFGSVCFKPYTEPTGCRAHESTCGFLKAAVLLSTGVLSFWAQVTIEILIERVAYLTLVYANTVGLRFKHKHTCHREKSSANVSVFSGELDVHGCDEHGDSRLPHLMYPRDASDQRIGYMYIKGQFCMEAGPLLQQR